jgi:hypothetical protein
MCALRAVGVLDGPRDVDACGDIELAKDVSQVRLDCFRAEEERFGDLRVGLTVDDEPRDLKFACC